MVDPVAKKAEISDSDEVEVTEKGKANAGPIGMFYSPHHNQYPNLTRYCFMMVTQD